MKKFIIISIVLILLAAGAFGYSLYRYMDVTGFFAKAETAPTTVSATEAAEEPTQPKPAGAANADVPAATGSGVFTANYTKAADYVATLSKEQMVGQMILGVCADPSTIQAEINKYSLSGMLFESSNFAAMDAQGITAALKTAADGSTIKPIFAAQEEGGMYTTVSDLPSFSEYDFNSPRSEFASGGLQAVEKAEDSKSAMLKPLGFNLNLAPVVDLAADGSQIMYSRSISDDVDTVSAYAEYAAKFDQAKGISVALKHFPGYGTIPDSAISYTGAIEDDRPAETIRNNDYTPFKKGAEAGAHVIMVSNVLVKNIDPTHTAALSPAIHNELRNTVGFTGVVMTELLDEADFSAYADGKKPTVQAVLAGNDIVFVKDYATAYNDILEALNSGVIPEETVKEACTRVIAYKYTAGIIK